MRPSVVNRAALTKTGVRSAQEEPVSDAIDARTYLVQMPPGTPPGFLVTQVFCEQGTEFDIPLAQCLMADLNTALVQQFLDVPVTKREAVIQPDRVLDDGHRETMAVRFRVSHGKLTYPDPVKAA